ncbi:MAG: hypothetical protein B6D65_00120 [candidate division Zixibacteria bacterium 4484_93]|nr:MAG: hypothetical protein B6D65_00120 [candidate division Zixibacteria bacterium 4484_93]
MRYYKGIIVVGAIILFALILSGCQTVLRTHSRVVISDPPDIVVDDCCDCCCYDYWWDDCCCCYDYWWWDTYCWHYRCFWHPVIVFWYPPVPYYYPHYYYGYHYYEPPPPFRYRGSYTPSGYRITRRRGLFGESGKSTLLSSTKYRSTTPKKYARNQVGTTSSATQVASIVGNKKIPTKGRGTGNITKLREKSSTKNSTRKNRKKDNSTALTGKKSSAKGTIIGSERNKKSTKEHSKGKRIAKKDKWNLLSLRKDAKRDKSTKSINKKFSTGYSSRSSFRTTAARGSSTRVKRTRRP